MFSMLLNKLKISIGCSKIRGFVLFAVLLILVLAPCFSQESLGRLVFIDGEVEVYREGQALDWTLVDIGLTLASYDLLETFKNSSAEIELTLPQSDGAYIKVKENTAFYFDIKNLDGKKQTNFQMLAGSILFKIRRLTASGEVLINTESATMGVRGTEFMVTAAADGSLLITCTEGLVSCTDKQGMELYARPGLAVEKISGESSRTISLKTEEIDAFRESWLKTREEVFKAAAGVFVKTYALRYLDFLPAFQDAYDELVKNYEVLKSAATGDRFRSFSAARQIKTDISPAVFKIRSIFPTFEHTFSRLEELEGYHRAGYGKVQIKRNYSSDDFFKEFLRIKKQVKIQMAVVRHIFKLYVELDKDFSGDSMMEEIFGTYPIEPIGPPGSGLGVF